MGKLAARYAKSLLQLSLENKVIDDVYNDMKLISNTCGENHELHVLLKSPIIDTHKKFHILTEIFGNKIQPLSLAFIKIIAFAGREKELEAIAVEFQDQFKRHNKIITAVVTTAFGLDDELRSDVLKALKKNTTAGIELVEKTDPKIIGGYIIRVGDQQDDASIARKLKSLNRTFNENPSFKEV